MQEILAMEIANIMVRRDSFPYWNANFERNQFKSYSNGNFLIEFRKVFYKKCTYAMTFDKVCNVYQGNFNQKFCSKAV